MNTALEPGTAAPDFTAPTDTGTFTLSDHRGKSVIVYFYPAAMTPGCTTQACDFRDSLSVLQQAGYEVVGVSKDSPDKLAEFRDKEGLNFTLVSDPDRESAEPLRRMGREVHVWQDRHRLPAFNRGGGPRRQVTLAQYNVKAKGHVAKLRRELGID